MSEMVERLRGRLNQFTTVRSEVATFNGWVGDPITGVDLADVSAGSQLKNALVEVGHELIFVSVHDPATSTTQVPPWFREQQGSPPNDDYPVGSRVLINPLWPYWHLAQEIADAVDQLYPTLYAVNTVELLSVATQERYELPADAVGVIEVQWEWQGGTRPRRQVSTFSFDGQTPDGNKVLSLIPQGFSGRPILVKYRARPGRMDPADPDGTFEDTGLPASAADLPVLYAASRLLSSAEAARVQTASVEQSDRSRLVQTGSANAASRRIEEQYQRRLDTEQAALNAIFPSRPRRMLNG